MKLKNIVWVINPGTLTLILCFSLSAIQGEVVFDKGQAVLMFNPKSHFYNDEQLDTPMLIHMIATMAKRFSKILLKCDTDDLGKLNSFVPQAVATYNKNKSISSNHSLELSLLFALPDDPDSTKNIISSILALANKANTVHPATVTTFYIVHPNPESCDQLESTLSEATKSLSKSPVSYKLGLLLPFERLQGIYTCVKTSSTAALHKVDNLIFLSRFPNYEDIEFGPQFKKFDDARLTLNKARTALGGRPFEMVFHVGPEKHKSDTQLVNYFKDLELWARNSKLTVLIFKAFDDIPDRHIKHPEKFGWWKLASNQSFETENYDFVEKTLGPVSMFGRHTGVSDSENFAVYDSPSLWIGMFCGAVLIVQGNYFAGF